MFAGRNRPYPDFMLRLGSSGSRQGDGLLPILPPSWVYMSRGTSFATLEDRLPCTPGGHQVLCTLRCIMREVGNRDRKAEEAFLQKHYKKMPRTMLRYAIEQLPERRRKAYLNGHVSPLSS